jgi:hypothetical protein
VFPILTAATLRFRRQRVWIAALLLPAAAMALAFSAVAPAGSSRAERGAAVLLFSLEHLLPVLAALFVLFPSIDGGADLLLTRPIRRPAILLGRWLGAAALFGGSHLLLAGGLWAGLSAAGGGPPGRLLKEPEERLIGLAGVDGRPAASLLVPWPREATRPGWVEAVEPATVWSFRFSGLPPGRPCRAQVEPVLGQVVSLRSGGKLQRELARVASLKAEVAFLSSDGAVRTPGGALELSDGAPAELEVPAAAVGGDGRLTIVLSRSAEPPPAAAEDEVSAGAPFFWFDPEEEDPLSVRDVRIAAGEIPFSSNALRAALKPLGKIFLVAGLAAAAAALFSAPLAFALTLALYLTASAIPFLRDILMVLSQEGARELLTDPLGRAPLPGPGLFERGLQALLGSWVAFLPDLGRFHAGASLARGVAVEWISVGRAALRGGGAALLVLALAAPFLSFREARR